MNKLKAAVGNERGEFGIKQIAIVVGVIIIIGFIVSQMESRVGGFIDDVWRIFKDFIDSTFKN